MRIKVHIVRLPVVAALLLAWVFASNHCAIASLAGGHPPGHSCCEKKTQPKSPESGSCAEKCCGALSVPVSAAAVLVAPDLQMVSFLTDVVVPVRCDLHFPCLAGLSPPGAGLSFFVGYLSGTCHQPVAPPVFVA